MPQYRIEVVIDPTRAQRGSRQVERSLDRINDRAERMRRLVTRAFALVGVGAAIHQVAQLSDSFIDLQNRARIASDSLGGDLAGTLDAVTAVAVRTRAPVLALAGVFQRGSIAAKELNATQEELIRLAEIAGKAVAIQGGGLQTARGALTQLSQTLGQSIVRGEEFNSILEGAFPIALAAARGIERVGGSVGKLRTEIIEGRVTSEEFFRGILAGGDEIDRQFALTTPTIGQAFTVLRTGLIRSAEALNEIAGPIAGFIRDIGLAVTVLAGVERQQIVTPEQEGRVNAITASIEALRIAALATAVVLAGRFAQAQIKAANASINARVAHVGVLRAIAARREAIRDLRVFQLADIRATERGVAATDRIAAAHGRAAVATRLHAAAQRRLVTATGASTIVMAGLQRGLAVLGGPTGVVLLAAFAIYEFVSSVREQRAALREAVPELDAFREAIERLTVSQLGAREFGIQDRLRDTFAEIQRVEGELDALNARFSGDVASRAIGLPRGSETRFAAYQREVEELTADLDTLRGNAAAAEQQLNVLFDARLVASDLENLQDRLRDTFAEILRVEGELDALNERFAPVVFTIESGNPIPNEPLFAAYQREVEELTADLDTLRGNAAATEQQLEALSNAEAPSPPMPPSERDVEKALKIITRLRQTAEDDIAAAALSRIDQITRREEIGVAQAIELGRTRGVSAEQVEAAITSIRVAGALQRGQVIADEAERERQAEEDRVERVQRLNDQAVRSNDQAVRSITQSLVSLQSEYDQAVIAAIQKAEQTAAALDTESAAYEANLETVRFVLAEETRLAGVAEQERIAATERRADQEISLEHLRALERVRESLVEVGLASRDAAREAELWAEIQRRAIDLTAEGAEEALASIDAVVARARQLASDDPLAGLRIGLEVYANQLPSVAEQINDTVQRTFQSAEDALLNFATTGKLNFSDLVDSILADLARIAIRQALLGPISQALGSVLGGAFGGSTSATPPVNPGAGIFSRGQDGGLVTGPGGPRSDSILARLSNGEFVVNAAATRANMPLLDAINSAPAFQSGGLVRPVAAAPAPQGERGVSVQVIDNRTTSSDKDDLQVSDRRGPNGERQIRVIIEDTVDQAARGGRFDSSLGSRYGVRPSIAPR